MSVRTQGKRVETDEEFWDDANVPCWHKGSITSSGWEGAIEVWWIRPPCGHNNLLGPKPAGAGHEVDEHEDGTISVQPKPGNSNSILCMTPVDGQPCGWHGYVNRGTFYTV